MGEHETAPLDMCGVGATAYNRQQLTTCLQNPKQIQTRHSGSGGVFENNQLTDLGGAILCVGTIVFSVGTIWLLAKYGKGSGGGGGSGGSSCGGGCGGCGGGCVSLHLDAF